MALVSAKEMLQKAKAGHYAVGQFNICLLYTSVIHGTGRRIILKAINKY